MSTKGFLSLLVAILALGGSLGGAFAGGLALGKSDDKSDSQVSALAPSAGESGQQVSDETDQELLAQLRERFGNRLGGTGNGQDTPGQFGGRLGGQFGGQAGGGDFLGGPRLTGTITEIDGNIVTIDTERGPVQVTVADDTPIQRVDEVTLADLESGLQVVVTGDPGDDGTILARSVFLTPEGLDGFLGGGFPRQGFPGTGRPAR